MSRLIDADDLIEYIKIWDMLSTKPRKYSEQKK